MQLVVGNRMTDFAAATGAVTARVAIERLVQGRAGHGYILGQGLHDEDIQVIRFLGKAGNVPVHISEQDVVRAGRDVCHKREKHNQLISMPRKIDDNVFEADLLIDDRNEIMSDHLTGLHLQGMLLIEAVRQMFIAVGETQYGHIGVPKGGYVVFNRLDTRFEQFAFPVATRLRQTVSTVERPRADRTGFIAIIELFQEQGRVAKTQVEYTIFQAETLKPKEERLAKKALEALAARVAEGESVDCEEQPMRAAG